MNMEISARDKKLLVYLLAFAIIAAAYYFGARVFLDKQAINQDKVVALQSELNSLKAIYDSRDNYAMRINEEEAKIEEAKNKFPADLTQEKTLVMIQDIEDNTGAWISRISFTEEEIFSGSDEITSDEIIEESTSEDGTEVTSNVGGEISSEDGTLNVNDIKNVKQDLSLDYYCNYDNFKRFIDYINNYDSRLFIAGINATYSPDTNEVSGSLTLSQYALYGAGKEVEAPDFSGISTGTDNIFTTLNGTTGNTVEIQTLERTEDSENVGDTNNTEESLSNTESEDENEGQTETGSSEGQGPKPTGGII